MLSVHYTLVSFQLSIMETFTPETIADVVNDRIAVGLDPEGTVNLSQVLEKLRKKAELVQKQMDGYSKKIAVPNYEEKVNKQTMCNHRCE